MTSGSWRSALRSACANDRVSTPISRWLTIDLVVPVQVLDRVLDGHDVRERVLLMWSIIAASVVLLPLPVVPVTSTRPRSSEAIFLSTGGRPSSSIVLILWG
jgi:hypothetical protein